MRTDTCESSAIASGSKDASESATQAEAESLEKPARNAEKRACGPARVTMGPLGRHPPRLHDRRRARLRGSVHIEYTLARRGAERLWQLLHTEPYVHALGALTGNQAVQMVQAGLKAIYLSGWQVAADANLAGQMYPDQSLYPCNSVPTLVRAINNAFRRADQIRTPRGARTSTTSCRSSPTPRPASAGR